MQQTTSKRRRPAASSFRTSSTAACFLYCLDELTNNSGVILEKVVEYLYYNQKHTNSTNVPDMDIPPELCLELLYAADYLEGED
jgi:elongin-C